MNQPNSEVTKKPDVLTLDTSDWWVKVLGMLQHNWAVISENDSGTSTVYFFHDGGTTKNLTGYDYRAVRGMIAIVDSLEFPDRRSAVQQLSENRFSRLVDHPGPWEGKEPKGKIFDARESEPGIYSTKGYWRNN